MGFACIQNHILNETWSTSPLASSPVTEQILYHIFDAKQQFQPLLSQLHHPRAITIHNYSPKPFLQTTTSICNPTAPSSANPTLPPPSPSSHLIAHTPPRAPPAPSFKAVQILTGLDAFLPAYLPSLHTHLLLRSFSHMEQLPYLHTSPPVPACLGGTNELLTSYFSEQAVQLLSGVLVRGGAGRWECRWEWDEGSLIFERRGEGEEGGYLRAIFGWRCEMVDSVVRWRGRGSADGVKLLV